MIKELLNTEKEVEEILEKIETTRSSDNLLFVAYWMRKAPNVPFMDFWSNPRIFGGTSYKTVERCRRAVQARRPDLKDSHTARLREEAEMDYINYVIGG